MHAFLEIFQFWRHFSVCEIEVLKNFNLYIKTFFIWKSNKKILMGREFYPNSDTLNVRTFTLCTKMKWKRFRSMLLISKNSNILKRTNRKQKSCWLKKIFKYSILCGYFNTAGKNLYIKHVISTWRLQLYYTPSRSFHRAQEKSRLEGKWLRI